MSCLAALPAGSCRCGRRPTTGTAITPYGHRGLFFEDFGVAVERAGASPDDLEPPDFAAMAAAIERHGVRILAEQKALQ
ncbi:MAG: hypothetical protein JO286_00185 [Solirubrobacterales bacterium]|nr:hypothetical protein [Solirubrobacterales bacterium]MBV9365520.1 hypothetical protein [Solirubrobacterales bacterium]MBV9805560.1 hypothetical protein [Solirubrobacterales bacterium]